MRRLVLATAWLAILLSYGCTTPSSLRRTKPLAVDTPSVTFRGNTFIAPAGWTLSQAGAMTLLEAPEGGSRIALIDVQAADGESALATAWTLFRAGAVPWRLKVVEPLASRDGWADRKSYTYETSPNERRGVSASVRRANDVWTVDIADLADDVAEKRASQVGQVYGKLLPKGYVLESFAGRKAHRLDQTRIAELSRFVDMAMKATGVPGVGLGLYQDGQVVFAGGFGVRELGKPEQVDADTRFLIASNTKAMVTLMLARLVDRGLLNWDTRAVDLLPSFRLGSPETTAKVLVRHLICACTGMPRQDAEWILEFGALTPEIMMDRLGRMQPTSRFGELFQYSNEMAAAAGYIGGHVAYTALELGAAFDRTMQEEVLGPLAMKDSTFDFAVAERGNAATPHAVDVDGHTTLGEARANRSIIPIRPAGGLWSTVNDLLRYVAVEIAEGRLPDGGRYLSRKTLLERRVATVRVDPDVTYGMGLMTRTKYGVPVVFHGGDMIGFHSDMMWLPEQGVGAVVLTNGDPGWLIRTVFQRKLLEVLFDGRPEADEAIAKQAEGFFAEAAAQRKLLTIPADPSVAAAIGSHYSNAAIGEVGVSRVGSGVRFDFGDWASEMASKRNPDGTDSLVTIDPGMDGIEFVVKRDADRPELVLRDAQHEYVFDGRQ